MLPACGLPQPSKLFVGIVGRNDRLGIITGVSGNLMGGNAVCGCPVQAGWAGGPHIRECPIQPRPMRLSGVAIPPAIIPTASRRVITDLG